MSGPRGGGGTYQRPWGGTGGSFEWYQGVGVVLEWSQEFGRGHEGRTSWVGAIVWVVLVGRRDSYEWS